jgi:glucose/arabinose dehydrogenase
MTVDRETGDLWAGDVGQGSWEEVDRIERGANYGWDVVEGPDCYDSDDCDRNAYVAPRAAYRTHEGDTCAVTGGYVYRGEAMPELRGWYVYGDYCSGDVWAVDASRDAGDPIRLIEDAGQISSFAEGPDGELYLLTFDEGILKLAH